MLCLKGTIIGKETKWMKGLKLNFIWYWQIGIILFSSDYLCHIKEIDIHFCMWGLYQQCILYATNSTTLTYSHIIFFVLLPQWVRGYCNKEEFIFFYYFSIPYMMKIFKAFYQENLHGICQVYYQPWDTTKTQQTYLRNFPPDFASTWLKTMRENKLSWLQMV